jgi:putative transposase
VPRPARIQKPGVYHITARGNRRAPIYFDDDDRRYFLALRERVARKFDWDLREHCLLTNHFHLLIETERANLSEGMHRLNHHYAIYFNARHRFEGHLFQKRFWSRLIETEDAFADTIAYIAFNPVKAGLSATPWDWPWSSFYRGDRSFVLR